MEDIIGKKFNRLTVVEKTNQKYKNCILYKCKCDCGKETLAVPYMLKKGSKKSCGCLIHNQGQRKKPQQPDLTNQTFGRWHVLSLESEKRNKKNVIRYWNCECECGNKKKVLQRSLINGLSQSCGCLQKEIVSKNSSIHRMSNSRVYNIWHNMIQRCKNPKSVGYEHYGGRGITVCNEWVNSSENFIKWALENGYQDNLTIDRIDVNGNYEPSNCRWADGITQANNTTLNHNVTAFGETHTVTEWSRITGITVGTIYLRVKNGMSWEEAVTNPKKFKEKYAVINGIKKSVYEWCKEYKLNYTTVWRKIAKGFSCEEAIEIYKEKTLCQT